MSCSWAEIHEITKISIKHLQSSSLPALCPLTTGKNGRKSHLPTRIEWVHLIQWVLLLPHTPINWMNGWMYNKVNPIGKELMNHIHFTKSKHTKGRAHTQKVEKFRVLNRCPTLKPHLTGYLYWTPRLRAHPPPRVLLLKAQNMKKLWGDVQGLIIPNYIWQAHDRN